MEPSGVVLPDTLDRPGYASVDLAELEFGGKHDLSHQLMHGFACVHAGDRRIVNITNGTTHLDEVGHNLFLADYRVFVTRDDHFGFDDLLEGGDVFERFANLLPTHRKDIRKFRKIGSKEITGQKDLLIGKLEHTGPDLCARWASSDVAK